MSEETTVTYKVGDIANGHVLGEDNQWHPLPAPVSSKLPMTPAKKFYGSLAIGTVAVIVVGTMISTIGPETVTIHDDALEIAEACYDNDNSSNGTMLPGTRDFDWCVRGVADMMKSSYLHSDTEIVDSYGNPVDYGNYVYEVKEDVESFATKDWRP